MSYSDILKTIHTLKAQLAVLEGQISGNKAAIPSSEEAAPKPKRVLTEDQKAKMAAGRKAAAERRKADKAATEAEKASVDGEKASASENEAKPKRVLTDEQKAKMAAGRKAAAERRKAEKASAEVSLKVEIPPVGELEDNGHLRPLNLKGRKFVWDTETNGCYKRSADGSKGDWVGIYDPDSKVIDDSVEEP
jgi:hypothetical protein